MKHRRKTKTMKARKLAILHGTPVFSFPVVVTQGEWAATLQVNHYPKTSIPVIARDARDAADLVLSEYAGEPCVEVVVYGPKGGIAAKRWQGYESAIGSMMFRERHAATPSLFP